MLPLHLTMLLIFLSGPLMGTWHLPVAFGLMLLSLFAVGLLLLKRAKKSTPIHINPLILLPAISVLLTAFMLIPTPSWLHQLLAPHPFGDLSAAYQLLGNPLPAFPLSLDPPKTTLRLFQLITALALFVIIADASRSRRARKIIFNWIAISALTLFVIALGHHLLGARKIWGIYLMGGGMFQAPLLNPNHLSRLFGVFSLLCLSGLERPSFGTVMPARAGIQNPSRHMLDASLRWHDNLILIACATLSTIGVFLSQSRWGIVSFIFCLLFLFPLKRTGWLVLAFSALLCASLIIVDLSTLLDSNTYWAKIELLQNFPALFSKHWISGIGAGSLALEYHQTIQPNFEAISLFSTQYIVTHFENLTLQTFLDHGLFKGLIIAGLALWALAKVLKNSRPLAVILLFVWLADASDFSFESGAMLFLCSLTLALVPNQSSWQFNVARLSKQWALVCILGLAFCPTWLLAGPNYLNPRHSYAQAILAYRNGDWDKIEPWIQYTLHRRPVHYNSHLTLARAYRDITGYQLAIASNPGAFKTLLEESKNPKIIPIETKAALEILIKWHIKHKEPSMALSALIKLLNGRSPKGKEAIWLAEIRTFQQGIKKTLIESNDWHLELQDPCPFVRWRMHHLRYSLGAKEALSELEQTRDCLLNPELLRADLLIGMGEYARAMQIIRGIWRANPSDASIRSRYLSLEKALTPK